MTLTFIAPSNSIHSLKWINYFNKSGTEIYWISFYKSSIDIDKKINYTECTNIFSLIKNFKLLKKIFKKSSNVHLHYMGKFIWVLFLFRIKNLIVSPWGSDVKYTKAEGAKGLLLKYIFSKSKIITVDAEFMFEEVLKFGDFKTKLKRINFGTDTVKFSFNQTYSKTVDNIKIISLRSLEKIYSIDHLIKAINLLDAKMKSKINVDIFGSGTKEMELKNLVDELNLNNIIKFRGKYVYDELPKLLSNYQLYISTSLSDAGLSASTSEAMSVGVPVLSSDNSENIYWLKENGYIYRTGDIIHLKNQIEYFINDKIENIEQFRNISRKKIELHNSFNVEMEKMKDIYER